MGEHNDETTGNDNAELMEIDENEELKEEEEPKPWLGNPNELNEDEELVYENSAYEMIHRANCEWPCLSIDVILPERVDNT